MPAPTALAAKPRIIDQIALDALEAYDGPGGKDGDTDVGQRSIVRYQGRPAVDQEANGYSDGSWYHHGNAELGLARGDTVPLLQPGVDSVLERGQSCRPRNNAGAERDVIQPGYLDVLAVDALPQAREAAQLQIQQPIEVHHVEGEDLDDDLCEEQAEGANQRIRQRLHDGTIRLSYWVRSSVLPVS